MRFLPTVVLGLIAAAALASSASADSIVYAKDGNLFLISADGARGYQVTHDGGYSSPSQAADGTIGAVRGGRLVRLDRSGREIGKPVDAIGGPGSLPGIAGPYDARISPDGRRFAYWFYVQIATHIPYDPEHRVAIDTGSHTTWTWADRFTDPVNEAGIQKGMTQPDWLTNDRVVGTEGFWMNMWTWKLGAGADSAQYWFGLQDPPDQWGVAAFHWYDDPSLSPDGRKLAMTDGGRRLMLAAQHGPAWVGEPPYDIDYLNGTTPVSAPSLQCASGDVGATNPSWSRDSQQLAYGAGDGVRVMNVPDSLDCGAATERLIAPGGTEPAFGPAGVVFPRRVATLRGASLRPRVLHRGARTTLRFRVSARTMVRISDGAGRVRGLVARRGVNRVVIRPRGAAVGRHRVRITPAHGRTTSISYRIVR